MNKGMERPKYHGYECSAPDFRGRFHFGTRRFFLEILHTHVFRLKGGEAQPPPWPENWFDRKFAQAVGKFSDTFQKLDLVAMLLAIERMNIFENMQQRELERYFKHAHGLRATPIYLDSVLLYLRILADSVADVTPYLYPVSFGKQIRCRSFRKHRDLFLKKSELDSAYARILDNYTDWFDALAGKDAEDLGLRDKIVHHRGTFQLGYTVTTQVDEFGLTAGIIGDSGWLVDDVFPELIAITSGLFLFLDHFLSHFSQAVALQIGQPLMDLSNPYHTEYFRFDKPLASFWLFPKVDRCGFEGPKK